MLFPMALRAGASPEERRELRVFAPPPGSWTEYRMSSGSTTSFEGARPRRGWSPDESREAKVVLFRGRKGGEAALLVRQSASEREPAQETVVFLRFTPAGAVAENGLPGWEEGANEFLSHALGSLEAPPLIPQARWSTAERQSRWTSFPGEFEHAVERAGPFPGALVLKSRRTGPLKRAAPFGAGREPAKAFLASREIVFDEKSGQLLSYLVVEETGPADQGEFEPLAFKHRRTMEIVETAHRAFSGGEVESLEKELIEVKRAAAAPPGSDPLPILDAYVQAFPDGLLRPCAEVLRNAFGEETRRAAEARKREEELRVVTTGRGPAPELVLRDAEGRAVSLSDFKGKPVLLSFGDLSTPAGKAEARFLSQWQEKYRERGLVVISVLAQRPRFEEADFLEGGIRQLVLFEGREPGSENGSSRYGVYQRPAEFFIDREGQLVLRKQGFLTATAGLREEKVGELLLERKP